MTAEAPALSQPPLLKAGFRALNSDIELIAAGPGAGRNLGRARRWLAAYEDRFSRFRILSELSRLNAGAGKPFRASPALVTLVRLALELATRSEGWFDPTVLPALDAAGYDRSFELVTGGSKSRPGPKQRFTWRDVVLDPDARTIWMPQGCGVDLGGIGKGWAADRLARILGRPCVVNAGGDVHAGARPDPESSWLIGIADPFGPQRDVAVLALEDRGVATSSTLKRRWPANGVVAHHLIDPRTGRPSDSDAVQVTAIAPSTTEADFHAKVALLQGTEAGIEYLDHEPGVEGLVFWQDGVAYETAGFGRYRAPSPGFLALGGR